MTRRAPSSVTISAWAGSTNLGDELVLAALLAKLAARGASPVVLSVDPEGTTAAHGVAASGLPALLRRGPGRPAGVLLGGGGLLQDLTSPLNLPFHLGRTLLATGRRGSFAGIGLGAGPISSRAGARLTGTALRPAVAVSVRDQGSVDLLSRLGIRASLAADLAVSLPTPRVQVEGRVAVSLRPWTGGGGALPVALRRRGRTPATPEWFAPAMAAALDEVAGRSGLVVHFIALQADRDDAVHREVADRMRSPVTFDVPDVHTVVDEVASCQAVVAMRYHAGIAALLGGRPAVLIGYSPKVPSLAAEVPGGMAGLAWDEASLAGLPAAVERVLDRGEAVVEGRERLREREQVNDQVIDRLLEAIQG
ncbi:MAG: polysaccharide pyruvyl transferase family protein [Acidimicrobiales bacterium]